MADLTITRGARLAITGLLGLVLLIGAGNLWATYDQVGAVRGAYARAAHAAATVTQLCQAGNEARAQQTGLWEYLIHLSPAPKTAQGRVVLAKFEAHLHAVFAPRNCHAPLTRQEATR